jgi:hypothetical protein
MWSRFNESEYVYAFRIVFYIGDGLGSVIPFNLSTLLCLSWVPSYRLTLLH